jgi:hypothetical protein
MEKPRFIASHDIVQTPLPLLEFGEIFLADAESVLTVLLGQLMGYPAPSHLLQLQAIMYDVEYGTSRE